MPYDVVTKRHSKRIRDTVAYNNTDIAHNPLKKLKTIRRDRTDSRVLQVCAGTDFRIVHGQPEEYSVCRQSSSSHALSVPDRKPTSSYSSPNNARSFYNLSWLPSYVYFS